MAKKKKQQKKSQPARTQEAPKSEAWLPTRGGVIVVGIVSLGMVIVTVWQSSSALPFFESLVWGLIYGGSIWVVFLVVYLVNQFLRNR